MKRISFVNSAGPVTVSLLENYTFVDGTAITPINKNRNSKKRSALSVAGKLDATVTAGTGPVTLGVAYLPGSGTGSGKVGGAFTASEEFVLEPGRSYVIAITNSTSPGAAITVGYDLFWYEENAG